MASTFNRLSALDPRALGLLQRRMRGELLTPDSAGYEAARHSANWRFDQRPALIARCVSAQDVALALGLAREAGLDLAVRSGGHSLAGHSTSAGGLLIDLSRMRQILIDPLQRIARVQPGATSGELVQAAAHVPKARRATKPTYGSKQRRLEGKAKRSGIKAGRSNKADF